ncbi:hypothetical protein [Micromonospora tarapacensis]|uniref:hypothetical protein n=1 Tax=Micromonospora tarapacensis TaxID=2835305 RepID=UPI0038B36838
MGLVAGAPATASSRRDRARSARWVASTRAASRRQAGSVVRVGTRSSTGGSRCAIATVNWSQAMSVALNGPEEPWGGTASLVGATGDGADAGDGPATCGDPAEQPAASNTAMSRVDGAATDARIWPPARPPTAGPRDRARRRMRTCPAQIGRPSCPHLMTGRMQSRIRRDSSSTGQALKKSPCIV